LYVCVNVDGVRSASPSKTIHRSTALEWLGTQKGLPTISLYTAIINPYIASTE